MKCKAIKTFLHDQLGLVERGTEFEATAAQLGGVAQFVEVYQTKVTHEVPDVANTDGSENASEGGRKRSGGKRPYSKPS